MAKKGFDNFTYGVGLEIEAKSFKQVKDELKTTFEDLKKMVQDYQKALKLDPDADLSKLFTQVSKLESVMSGIGKSNNSFGNFVDKGVLDRINALENAIRSVGNASDEVQARMSGAMESINSAVDPLKASGQVKFPGHNIFTNVGDQTAEIKRIDDTIKQLKSRRKVLYDVMDSYGDITPTTKKANIENLTNWIKEFHTGFKKIEDIGQSTGKLSLSKDIMAEVSKLSGLGDKISAEMGNSKNDNIFKQVLSKLGISDISLDNELAGFSFQVNKIISRIDVTKSRLEAKVSELRAQQNEYSSNANSRVNGRSLGVIRSEGDVAQVQINPKVNEAEWAGLINGHLKNIQARLEPIELKPTLLKASKNVKKTAEGALEKIDHKVNVDINVISNIERFNSQIRNIDQSIKNAKALLEKNGNFKLKFEYEEGGRFRDAAYKILNQFKKFELIDVKFRLQNSAKYFSDLEGVKKKTQTMLNDIPASVIMNNQEKVINEAASLRTKLVEMLSNINVGLQFTGIAQGAMPITLTQGVVTQQPEHIQSSNNIIGDTISAQSSVAKVTNEVGELSEKAKQAAKNVDKTRTSLQSLNKGGIHSDEFLALGDFDEKLVSKNGLAKSVKGSKADVRSKYDQYIDLDMLLNSDREILAETYGANEKGYEAYYKDLRLRDKLESELNDVLKRQVAHQKQKLANEEKIFAKIKNNDNKSNKQSTGENITTTQSDDNILFETVKSNTKGQGKPNKTSKRITDTSASKTSTVQQDDLIKITKDRVQALDSLNRAGISSPYFISNGVFDETSGQLKKDSEIKKKYDKYQKLKNTRVNKGQDRTHRTSDEIELENFFNGELDKQKKYLQQRINEGQNKILSFKADIDTTEVENKISALKSKLAKEQSNLDILNKSKSTINRGAYRFDALTETGIGDVEHRLSKTSTNEDLKDVVGWYNMSPDHDYEQKNTLKQIRKDQIEYAQNAISSYKKQIQEAEQLLEISKQQTKENETQTSPMSDTTTQSAASNPSTETKNTTDRQKELNNTLTKRKAILADLEKNGRKSEWFTKLGKWDKETGRFTQDSELKNMRDRHNQLVADRKGKGISYKNKSKEERQLNGQLTGALSTQKSQIKKIIAADEKELASLKSQVSTKNTRPTSKSLKPATSNDNKNPVVTTGTTPATSMPQTGAVVQLDSASLSSLAKDSSLQSIIGKIDAALQGVSKKQKPDNESTTSKSEKNNKKNVTNNGPGVEVKSVQNGAVTSVRSGDMKSLYGELNAIAQTRLRSNEYSKTKTNIKTDGYGVINGASITYTSKDGKSGLVENYKLIKDTETGVTKLMHASDVLTENIGQYEKQVASATKAQDNLFNKYSKDIQGLKSYLDPNANNTLVGTQYEEVLRSKINDIEPWVNQLEMFDNNNERILFSTDDLREQERLLKSMILDAKTFANESKNAQSVINQNNNKVSSAVEAERNKFKELSYNANNSKVKMEDVEVNKLKEYTNALDTLGAKQKEIAAQPKLLDDAAYMGDFDSLLMKIKSIRKEFETLRNSAARNSKDVNLVTVDNNMRSLTALEEQLKRSGMYTDELKAKFKDLSTQLQNVKTSKDLDSYKMNFNSVKTEIEQLKTYKSLYDKLVQSRSKQIELGYQVKHETGSTGKASEELAAEKEISKALEMQIRQHSTLYNRQANEAAWAEARAKAEKEIAQSTAAQADKAVNSKYKNVSKSVDSAQGNYEKMVYNTATSNIPMAEPAIAKLKEYESLLERLQQMKRKIEFSPSLLSNEQFMGEFDSVVRQMDKVSSKFTELQQNSEKFTSKIRDMSKDVKQLDDAFDPLNFNELSREMQKFANQVGVGDAKFVKFGKDMTTALYQIKDGAGHVQNLTVEYDEGTRSLGRYVSGMTKATSGTEKFVNNIKNGFSNVTRYLASFGSVYELFTFARQGVQYVRDIDLALTELKKVTNETDATYSQFLQSMSKTGSQVGATVADLTNSAADWARLNKIGPLYSDI